MTMKVTYTDRNNNIHVTNVSLQQYRHLIASLAWTKGKIEKVENIG